MVNMVVDIIVPVYNVSKYLNKCIESLLAQTYKYIKIILVDDGSTDGSEKICDNYARIDDRINVIHKENGGLVSAWTMGIKNSKSEWVVFVDGDDWVEYKHIELLVKEQMLEDYKATRNSHTKIQFITPSRFSEIFDEGIQ